VDARLPSRASDSDPDEAASGLSSEQLFDALYRTRHLIILLMVLGLAGASFVSIVTPNTFMSVGKVMVRWGSREQTTTDSVDGPRNTAASSRAEDIQTEIQLLSAPIVFERTVRKLGATAILKSGDPTNKDDAATPAPVRWFHTAQKWWLDRPMPGEVEGCCTDHTCPRCIDAAIRALQSRVIIASSPGTSVIDVACIANGPEEARRLVVAFLAQIEERHREVFATDPAYEFLKAEMAEAKEARDRSAMLLADSRQQCHVYDLPAQRGALLKEKDGLDALARNQQTELKSIGSQLLLFSRWMVQAKEKTPETTQVPAPNPTYDLRLKRVEELRTQRDTLLATRVPDSPEVVEIERQIAAATDTLNATPTYVMVDSTTSSAAQVTRLQNEMDALMARQKGIEAAAEATAIQKSEVDDALEKLANCEPDLRGKEKEVETKTAAAAHFTEAFDRYAVTKALDEAKMSNLRPIQEPTLPYEKSGPNRRMFILLGLMLGGGIGFLIAFVRAAFDRKLRTARDVERLLRVPVICTIPEVARLRKAVS
jgi:uncharacterized protein involved in exopolysaccharide biosynthesis